MFYAKSIPGRLGYLASISSRTLFMFSVKHCTLGTLYGATTLWSFKIDALYRKIRGSCVADKS